MTANPNNSAKDATIFSLLASDNTLQVNDPKNQYNKYTVASKQYPGDDYPTVLFLKQLGKGDGLKCDFGKDSSSNQVNCQSADGNYMFWQFCQGRLRLNDGPVADDGCATVVLSAVESKTM